MCFGGSGTNGLLDNSGNFLSQAAGGTIAGNYGNGGSSANPNPLQNLSGNISAVIGQLNGSTAANAQNQKDVNAAEANQQALVTQQTTLKEQNEVSASNTASNVRTTANSQATNSLGFNTPSLVATAPQGPEKDFLGL